MPYCLNKYIFSFRNPIFLRFHTSVQLKELNLGKTDLAPVVLTEPPEKMSSKYISRNFYFLTCPIINLVSGEEVEVEVGGVNGLVAKMPHFG